MSRDKIWNLFARKLVAEASKEEIQELETLLNEDSSFYYDINTFIQYWEQESFSDDEYLEATYLLHFEKMKKMGIEPKQDEVAYDTIEENQLSFSPFLNKRNMRLAGVLLAGLAILTFTYLFIRKPEVSEAHSLAVYNNQQSANEISTKKGANVQFKLPDGSTVWLNAGSKLNYEKINQTNLREVYLTGEAFFDVTKNPHRPFIIHTSSIDIKVIGTAFNVKAYPEDKTVETSLIRGKVEITLKNNPAEKYVLKPNQKLVLNNTYIKSHLTANNKIAAVNVPVIVIKEISYINGEGYSKETAWMQNELSFEEEAFKDVAVRMGRWYDVEFEFKNKRIEEEQLTGSFEMETLKEALEALKITTKFNYKIEGKKVTIF